MIGLTGDLLVVGPPEGAIRVLDLRRLPPQPGAGPSEQVRLPVHSLPPDAQTPPVAQAPLLLIPSEVRDWAAAKSTDEPNALAESLPQTIDVRKLVLSTAERQGDAQKTEAAKGELEELRLRLRAVQTAQQRNVHGASGPAETAPAAEPRRTGDG